MLCTSQKHAIMKKITFLLWLILLISGKVYSQNENSFYIGSFESALEKAKQENKFVFIDFYTVWCGSCKAYEKYVFNKPEIKTYIKDKFIAVSIDAEKGESIERKKKYEVFSYPQIIITYPDGKEIDRISGFNSKYSDNPKEFIKKIDGILDGTSTLASLEKNVKSNPKDIKLKEKLISEYINRDQYSKIRPFAKELMQVKDSLIKNKGEFYNCLSLIKDKETRDPNPMINLLKKNTSLTNIYIGTGYASLLSYYKRINDLKNIDFYYQKVIEIENKLEPNNWYSRKHYALFLFENNMNIKKAQQIAEEYYKVSGIVDHYQPLLMAYSFVNKNDTEKGMQNFDEWMKKTSDLSIADKQWAYYYYSDFANKFNLRLDKALEYAKAVSDYTGENVENKILLANLLDKNHQTQAAIDVLKNCLNYVQAENHYSEINDLIKKYESK
jgi:thioredoxin-related protein